MAPEGCAIGTDGKLLDASEIKWFNDPDDDEPMGPVATSSTVQSSLDSFFTTAPLPAPPPPRRSDRIPRPSTKAIDPDNAMAAKRKTSDVSTSKPNRRLRQASLEHEEDRATEPDATEANLSDGSDTEDDDDPVNPGEAYEEIKALGDADRKVCVRCPSQIIH